MIGYPKRTQQTTGKGRGRDHRGTKSLRRESLMRMKAMMMAIAAASWTPWLKSLSVLADGDEWQILGRTPERGGEFGPEMLTTATKKGRPPRF